MGKEDAEMGQGEVEAVEAEIGEIDAVNFAAPCSIARVVVQLQGLDILSRSALATNPLCKSYFGNCSNTLAIS